MLLISVSIVLISAGCLGFGGSDSNDSDDVLYEQTASENILTEEQVSEYFADFEVQRINTSDDPGIEVRFDQDYYESLTSKAIKIFNLIKNGSNETYNNGLTLGVGMLNDSDDVIEETLDKENISYTDENVRATPIGDTIHNDSV